MLLAPYLLNYHISNRIELNLKNLECTFSIFHCNISDGWYLKSNVHCFLIALVRKAMRSSESALALNRCWRTNTQNTDFSNNTKETLHVIFDGIVKCSKIHLIYFLRHFPEEGKKQLCILPISLPQRKHKLMRIFTFRFKKIQEWNLKNRLINKSRPLYGVCI